METEKLKIIIVDDNKTFRDAMKLFLVNELKAEIIGEASNGQEFLNLSAIIRADLVLMDIEMPELDGISATKKWCLHNPLTKVIGVTMYTDKVYLLRLVEAGFKGCVFKTNFFNEITKAIETVHCGNLYFNDNLPVE